MEPSIFIYFDLISGRIFTQIHKYVQILNLISSPDFTQIETSTFFDQKIFENIEILEFQSRWCSKLKFSVEVVLKIDIFSRGGARNPHFQSRWC